MEGHYTIFSTLFEHLHTHTNFLRAWETLFQHGNWVKSWWWEEHLFSISHVPWAFISNTPASLSPLDEEWFSEVILGKELGTHGLNPSSSFSVDSPSRVCSGMLSALLMSYFDFHRPDFCIQMSVSNLDREEGVIHWVPQILKWNLYNQIQTTFTAAPTVFLA